MNNIDYPVFNLKYLLKMYEDHKDLKERTIDECMAFVAFFDANGLFSARPFQGDDLPLDLTIYESHLSEDGKKLFRNLAIEKWVARNDDITKPISMRVLERELKKLRG